MPPGDGNPSGDFVPPDALNNSSPPLASALATQHPPNNNTASLNARPAYPATQPLQQPLAKAPSHQHSAPAPDGDSLPPVATTRTHLSHSKRKSNPFKAFSETLRKHNPLRRNAGNDDDTPYEVVFPCPDSTFRLKSNYIRTTKYTIYSFLPKTLYYQFRRFYNIYFLAGALSVIAGVSSLSPASQILPLVVVLAFSLAKEAYEDYHRYKADRLANTGPITLLRNGSRLETTRMYIQPGDIVCLEKGEKSPVDAIILSTNYEDGTCFVETAELDGETNLKRRSAVVELAHYNTDEKVSSIQGTILCEQPNDKLNTFDGLISVTAPNGQPSVKYPLTPTNVILRGSNIRNTTFAYALVVYTGANTKIIRNLKKPKLKTSTLEKKINWLVMGAFVVNAIFLISSVSLEWRFYKNIYDRERVAIATDPVNYPVLWYLGPVDDQPSRHVLNTIISFFALYTYVIPISLFVTIEIVRVVQAKYIQWDLNMRSYMTNSDGTITTVKSKANNSNLNEDLGVVEYVFSDKTGTVTRNEMKVVGWYLDGIGNVPAGIADGAGKLGRLVTENSVDEETKQRIIAFGHALALCHNVIPAPDPRIPGELLYESQSPDESALLFGIKTDGFTLLSRTKAAIKITDPTSTGTNANPLEFGQLALLDFTSDRKRMSIIVRAPDGVLTLYCKGADNIVLERLAADQADLVHHADASLKHYSEQGYRTLVVAYRTLTDEEYEDFRGKLDEAERALTNREESIAAVSEEIEKNLRFLGVTAIEDRLQDRVPETIEFLVDCGIKVWLLTGDKMETAINIGMSSRLILPDMSVLILDALSEQDLAHQVDSFTQQLSPSSSNYKRAALIIPGSTLATIFSSDHPHLPPLLLTLSQLCTTVIACRVTPLQKALVVQLVQRNLKCTTLAIGDGANDVSMIQAANVGVGVVGREGTQAVRAADYAIGEFRHLARLLTVHGRWSRLRLSSLVFYSFYKNLVMITVQWWFGFQCAWSGSLVYEEIFLTGYNIVFTSLPPLFIAVFDYDCRPDVLLEHPQLYKAIRKGLYWSRTRMFRTLFEAFITASLIFYFVYIPFHDNTLDPGGYTAGYYTQTYLFSTPMLIVVLIRAGMMHVVWVGRGACITAGVLVLSLVANLIVMGIVELFKWVDEGTFESVHVLTGFWTVTVLVVATCSGGALFIKYFFRHIFPRDTDILHEESVGLTSSAANKELDHGDQQEMGVAGR
ncbi:hypothetical protein DFJ77DRAFT_470897 [Powellomyces hirtus]|nr:hypothetical protein DFJ77DRAFT_470897 [Powellomyces hirtus]